MPDLSTLFGDPRFQIPVIFSSDDFKTEVSKLLTAYIDAMTTAGVDNHTVDVVKKFRYSISYVLTNYLRGIHSNAYDNFEKAMAALQIIESPLLSAGLGDVVMYRGRENKETEDFVSGEMFHIPLDSRGIIATQRYSFPGLPCLYVGASAYTCWVELNRPSFEKFQVATIKTKNPNMKVLDLSWIPQKLDEVESCGMGEDYLRYWPLLALCSVKVRCEENTFKPEYIFPQFLLEYILKRSSEHVGIKYASIKVATINKKQLSDDPHTYVNYVFPSHSDQMNLKDCSYLAERFVVDRTRSGRELQILCRMLEIDKAKVRIGYENETLAMSFAEKSNNWNIYTRDGKPYPYATSVFNMIEEALRRDDFNMDTSTPRIGIASNDDIDEMFDEIGLGSKD